MKNLQLVIFDMDGLIFDTETLSYRALRHVFWEDHQIDFPIATYKKMIGMGPSETESILHSEYGDSVSLEQLFISYGEAFNNMINQEGIATKMGVATLLDHLDEQGIKKCVASSSRRETIQHYLALSNLTDRFDFYLSGEEVENGKPHPDIFLEACRHANVSPEHALVLEDSVHGFHAAKRAQIACIVIPDLIEATPEMNETAYKVLPDLRQVIKRIH